MEGGTTTDTTTTTDADHWVPDWDGEAYAANTGHHREHDAWFLEQFPVRANDRVLDLACGSGDFTHAVAALVPGGEVVGVDAQATMLDEARVDAAPHERFVLGPVQDLDEMFPAPDADGTFDVVMSRSALHWVPEADHAGVLASAFRLLAPGGWLRIECGGGGNVPVVRRAFDAISAGYDGPSSPWTFLDAGTYLELTEAAGFVLGDDGYVRTVAQRRRFDRESFAGWLGSQAIEAYASGIAEERRDAFRAEVLDRIDDFRRADGTFDQTYVRLDLLVRKPA